MRRQGRRGLWSQVQQKHEVQSSRPVARWTHTNSDSVSLEDSKQRLQSSTHVLVVLSAGVLQRGSDSEALLMEALHLQKRLVPANVECHYAFHTSDFSKVQRYGNVLSAIVDEQCSFLVF